MLRFLIHLGNFIICAMHLLNSNHYYYNARSANTQLYILHVIHTISPITYFSYYLSIYCDRESHIYDFHKFTIGTTHEFIYYIIYLFHFHFYIMPYFCIIISFTNGSSIFWHSILDYWPIYTVEPIVNILFCAIIKLYYTGNKKKHYYI